MVRPARAEEPNHGFSRIYTNTNLCFIRANPWSAVGQSHRSCMRSSAVS
jgi:hypothetical protein